MHACMYHEQLNDCREKREDIDRQIDIAHSSVLLYMRSMERRDIENSAAERRKNKQEAGTQSGKQLQVKARHRKAERPIEKIRVEKKRQTR